MSTAHLYSQALCLPSNEREELVMLLLDSLGVGDDQFVVDDELQRVIERRVADRVAGVAQTVDLETFAATLRQAANPRSS